MKQTNKLKMITAMAVSITVSLFTSSCSNDVFFGFDDIDMLTDQRTDSKFNYYSSVDDYLTISSFDVNKWTEKDFISFSESINRLGVSYSISEHKYIYNDLSSNDINVSDSLLDCIRIMLGHTNSVISSSTKASTIRIKNRSPEGSNNPLPDCVPAAIANMGKNAPTYSTAIAKCDELFPNWRTHNGVPSDSIEFFIECYTPVTEYKNLSFCSSGVTTLPNIVMRFAHHAVNAYRVSIINGLSVIYYEDHSSTSLGSSFILGTEMSQIFPFDNN